MYDNATCNLINDFRTITDIIMYIHMYLDLCFTSGDVIMYSLVVYIMYILTNRLLWTGSDLQSSCSAWPCPFHGGGSRYRPALQSEWTNPHRQASPSSRSPVKGIKRMLLYYFEFFFNRVKFSFHVLLCVVSWSRFSCLVLKNAWSGTVKRRL